MINKNFIQSLFFLLVCYANLNGTIKFNSQSSALALDQTNSGLTLSTSMPITYGTLKLRNATGTTDGNIASATGAETITFTDGSVKVGTTTVDLTGGTYDPKTGSTRDVLSLGNGQVMSVSAGTTIFNDVAVANSATATILGCPTFVSSVSLGNSSSVLNLAIQNKLNKDIVLNSGKLVLQDNLELADGIKFTGPGTIDINYQSLRFGTQVNSSVFSQDITFWRAKDITLNGPVTLAGNWTFVTNSTDNESVLNGNGNILTLNGGGLVVGDVVGGHTLYISDLHIKGLTNSALYTAPGYTKSQYDTNFGAGTPGSLAYNAGFVCRTDNTFDYVSVYDDPTPANSYIYGLASSNFTYRENLTVLSTAVSTQGDGLQSDVGIDGVAIVQAYGSIMSQGLYIYNGTYTKILTNGTYTANPRLAIGSSSHIYYTSTISPKTQVSKYLGTPESWNHSWATGYSDIQCITASSDGYLWILDSDNLIYKTNGGPKSGATVITPPENPTTFAGSYTNIPSAGALSFKGSTSMGTLYGAYCGTSGTIYTITNGSTFTALGAFGGKSVGVGGSGTICFVGPNNRVFTKAPASKNVFNLYDGGATDANRGKVILSNVTLELAGNYTHSAGHITFKGDNCKIITGGNKTFTISGSNAPVEVDSVTLTYDTLAGTNTSPFTGTAITLTNGGIVRSASQPGETIIDANLYNGSSAPTLVQNYSLSQKNGGVTVTNATGAASQTVTINGGNYFWDFPGGSTAVLTIADKVTVTLTNVILKNFSLSNVSFGGASAALVFGDGCVIELGADQSLTTGQGAWLFSGNATIRAMGQNITLNNTDSIRQNVANKTLTISSAILKSFTTLSLGCASLGKVVLSNSTLQINTGGFSWSSGNLDISGYSKLSAMNITTSGGSANFNLTTSGQMTVTSGSTLEFGRAINFAYSPTTTGDTGGITGTIAKRHFALGSSGDASATLYASNCSIDSTAVGMALDRGNLVINNKVVFTASSTASYESELGSALNVELLAESLFRIDGGIKYTITTV